MDKHTTHPVHHEGKKQIWHEHLSFVVLCLSPKTNTAWGLMKPSLVWSHAFTQQACIQVFVPGCLQLWHLTFTWGPEFVLLAVQTEWPPSQYAKTVPLYIYCYSMHFSNSKQESEIPLQLWAALSRDFFFKGRKKKKKHASGFFYVPRTHHLDLGSLEFVTLLPQLSAEITDHYPQA